MKLDQESLKFIFGLKMSHLRKDRGLSLKDLGEKAGLSASYLNEIENGKKYPKGEKILAIAEALGVNYDELISVGLSSELNKLSSLLENNPIAGLPLDLFGFSPQTLFQFIARDPKAFTALSGTLLELARIFNIQVQDVYAAVLRSYLHMNRNYFPHIEQKVDEFRGQYQIQDFGSFLQKEQLKSFLLNEFQIEVLEADFKKYPAPVPSLYFFLQSVSRPRLYLNKNIGNRQKTFILAREIGYAYQGLKQRFRTSLTDQPDTYEQLFNLFTASYFASSLIIPKQSFMNEIEYFLHQAEWSEQAFAEWAHKYPGTRRSFFHRLSQLLPFHFGLENIFYFRFNYHPKGDDFQVIKELHLSELQVPHRLKGIEHYCRRWIATSLVKELSQNNESFKVGVQRAHFVGTGREYLCFSMAYPINLDSQLKEGITLGILIDDKVRESLGFLEDQNIPRAVVSRFCEWCPIESCQERVAPASGVQTQKNIEFLHQWDGPGRPGSLVTKSTD